MHTHTHACKLARSIQDDALIVSWGCARNTTSKQVFHQLAPCTTFAMVVVIIATFTYLNEIQEGSRVHDLGFGSQSL